MRAMKIPCRVFIGATGAAILHLSTLHTQAQVRITEVTISTRNVEVTNFGTAAVNLSGWFFCHRFTYPGLSGSIAPKESRQFTVNFNQTSSDLCLYNSGSFGTTTAMEDFIQWGASGIGRENVAVSKGIWTAGFFFAVPPAGKSLHAKAQPPATGLRTTNWFPGWPHAGFPVPDMKFESIAITGGEWRIFAQSYYLTNAHIVDVSSDLSSPWVALASPVISELGDGRIEVRFPATGDRQFSRLRAQ